MILCTQHYSVNACPCFLSPCKVLTPSMLKATEQRAEAASLLSPVPAGDSETTPMLRCPGLRVHRKQLASAWQGASISQHHLWPCSFLVTLALGSVQTFLDLSLRSLVLASCKSTRNKGVRVCGTSKKKSNFTKNKDPVTSSLRYSPL